MQPALAQTPPPTYTIIDLKTRRLHVENDAVFLLNIAAHISATGVGVYVRQNNKEPFGCRSSPSLECGLLPGLRDHQQQSR
jgi:hypothetical protein